ncbi:MAG: hypothetical protein EOL88_04080 [Bacteroidia bacterium]|nr:hypothetical protein [Bacteroidia bacterium]
MAKNLSPATKISKSLITTMLFSFLTILVVYLIQHPNLLNLQLWPRYFTLAATVLGFSLFFLFCSKKHKNTINTALWRDPLFLSYGLLAIVMLFSLHLTINISEGLMDASKYVLMFFFFALSLIVFNHEAGYRVVAKIAVITLLGLLIWAFAQYIPRYLWNNTGGIRDMDDVRVNFVRSNQYCIGAFLLLPFALFQYFQRNKFWNVITSVSLFGTLFFIVSIQTRSVWVALILGALVAGLLFLFSDKALLGKSVSREIFRKSLLIAVSLVVFFALAETLARLLPNSRSSLRAGVEKTFDPSKKFGAGSRLVRWEATLRLVKANPVFGEGAGDWKTVKYKYGLYDNSVTPHNDYLWVLSDSGLVGFTFYMLLFLLAFIYLLRAWFRAETPDDKLMALCLLFGLVGYMAIQSFTFPKKGISHQVMLTLYFVFSIILNNKVRRKVRNNVPNWVFHALLILVLLITPAMLTFAVVRYQSEHNERIALAYRGRGDHKNVIKYMALANTQWSNIDPFNHSISSYIAEAHYYLDDHSDAIKYYTQALRESPYNPNYWVNRAMAYSKVDLNDKALQDLNQALKIKPDYELALTNKAVIYFNRKEFETTSAILYHILEKNKRAGKAYYMLGLIHLQRKQLSEACSMFSDAVKYKFEDAQKYIDVYCLQK